MSPLPTNDLPRQSWLVRACYDDRDLGPILRSERFKPFREKFPEPVQDPDQPDELGALWAALLLQPIGVDEAWAVIIGFGQNRLQEIGIIGHGQRSLAA